jgi:hypothetical protein
MQALPEKVNINNCDYSVAIEFKKKKNSSAKVYGDTIVLRISNKLSRAKQQEHIKFLLFKLEEKMVRRNVILNPYTIDLREKFYIAGQAYNAEIFYQDRKTCRITLDENNTFRIYLPEKNYSRRALQEAVKRGILKSLKPRNQEFMENLVHYINKKHFNYDVREVKLKAFQSRWGECNSENVITLNVMLLFCPLEVAEYIVIHELAHINMLNHSKAFWDRVSKALPEHEKRKEWLNENGSNILNLRFGF